MAGSSHVSSGRDIPDLRRSERAKTGGAKIIFNNRMSTMDFIVKYISSSGAKLAQPCSAADPQFVLERIDLAPQSNWELHAEHETWVLVLEGCANIEVGATGLKGLLAYLDPEPSPSLLHNPDGRDASFSIRHSLASPPHHRAIAGSPVRSMETQP
jgi:hypothetical protein